MAKNDVHLKIFFSWVLSKDLPASFPGWGVIFLSRSELFIRFIHLSYNTYLIFLPQNFPPIVQLSLLPLHCVANSHWKLLQNLWNQHFSFLQTVQDKRKVNIVGLQKFIWHRIGYCTLYCRGWRRISCATYCRYLAVFVPKLAALFGLFRTYQLSSDAQNRRHLLNI